MVIIKLGAIPFTSIAKEAILEPKLSESSREKNSGFLSWHSALFGVAITDTQSTTKDRLQLIST